MLYKEAFEEILDHFPEINEKKIKKILRNLFGLLRNEIYIYIYIYIYKVEKIFFTV